MRRGSESESLALEYLQVLRSVTDCSDIPGHVLVQICPISTFWAAFSSCPGKYSFLSSVSFWYVTCGFCWSLSSTIVSRVSFVIFCLAAAVWFERGSNHRIAGLLGVFAGGHLLSRSRKQLCLQNPYVDLWIYGHSLFTFFAIWILLLLIPKKVFWKRMYSLSLIHEI